MKTNELTKKEALNYVFKNSPVISIRFDKRKSIVRQVLSLYTIGDLLEIEAKKMNRINNCVKSYAPIMRYRDLIDNQRKAPSSYKKLLISSINTIYLASPIYGLEDYNRSLFFGNNPANLKKAELINQLIIKKIIIMEANYLQAKRELIEKGIDFGKNVYALTSEENKLLEQTAKKYKYRITSCDNSCLGVILHWRFYMLLQKVNL